MLEYRPCYADPDLWMRMGVTKRGKKYYKYVLLYLDDCLTIGEDAIAQLKQIDKYFPMKEESIGPPKLYLGPKLNEVELPNGVTAYAMSMSRYAQEAISNLEKRLRKKGLALPKKVMSPFTTGYIVQK